MPECWSLFFNKVAVKFTGKHLQAPASETNSLCLQKKYHNPHGFCFTLFHILEKPDSTLN